MLPDVVHRQADKLSKKLDQFSLTVSDFNGTREVAERIVEKYDSGDFSDEQHTVYYRGEEMLITITEAEGNIFETARNRLSDRTDRIIGIGVTTRSGFETTVIHPSSVDRTQRLVEATLVSQDPNKNW